MCSRCLKVVAGCAALLLLTACEREQRRFSDAPSAATAIVQSELQPGVAQPAPLVAGPYADNAYDVSEGKRLFEWFNCAGCHAHGGGDIGPPLMDEKWIYGNSAANVYQTLMEGRPNGMPSFRAKLNEQQTWQLVAYVRSMSGQLPKDISPSRNDDMNVAKPEQMKERERPVTKEAERQQ